MSEAARVTPPAGPTVAGRPMRATAVGDPTIVWSAASLPPEAMIRPLSSALLDELDRNRHLLQIEIPLEGSAVDAAAADGAGFPALAREAAEVRREVLDGGLGFVILRGLEPSAFSATEMENVFWRMCNRLGVPLVQKAGRIRFGRVENLGLPPDRPARYHETGVGGSVHTDSPIMPRVADYVGLLSVRTALEGGRSKFVSIAGVHDTLLKHAPELLAVLYQPFYFDRRIPAGEVTAENPLFLHEPIFTYDPEKGDRGLRLRWQPEYVWEAPRLSGVPPLSAERQLALHLLEGLLEDRAGDMTVCVDMRPGDIQLLNNHLVAHGRTAFIDPMSADDPGRPDPDRRRLLRRVWLRRHH